jgi:hypothetical protein
LQATQERKKAMRTTVPPALDDALVSPAFYPTPYPLYEQLWADLPVVWSKRMGAWLIALQLATTIPDWLHHNLVRGLASLAVVF